MQLQHPFIQLPIAFDATALADELAGVPEADWRAHPQGFPGNSALPLISVDGDPADDGFAGSMRPTPHLARLPYLRRVLGELGGVWGRTRLMRLSGQAEVSPHVDQGHYWAERLRVHVPITTQPGVRFCCGDGEVHMAAGECWIFDTWRLHRVLNATDAQRIHLVADTVGGEGLWALIDRGRPHHAPATGWRVRRLPPDASAPLPELQLESRNTPAVMTPWELRHHLGFLLNEAVPHPGLRVLDAAAVQLVRRWTALWAQYGDDAAGRPHFRRVMDAFMAFLRQHGEGVLLKNEVRFLGAFAAMVGKASLGGAEAYGATAEAPRAAPPPPPRPSRDPWFDRPVVVVSPPRSGSTLLFETLARAPGLYTVGGESHALMEGVPSLHPSHNGWHSNRAGADLASSDVVQALRERFAAALRDRDEQAPTAAPVRLLEKTPKNALRIPFLQRVFPEARFVYLYRDPREVLASMIEAWQSGRFRTYPRLPGWNGPPWSLLLVPGWRELSGKPLHEIVAAQWEATTRVLLDDLHSVPAERVSVVRYDALRQDPQAAMQTLCAQLDLEWDQQLDATLPASRYTVSAPAPEKWRRHEDVIAAVWPVVAATAARAAAFAAA